MTRIMIVDDQKSICNAVRHAVESSGFEFCSAQNGHEAIRMFESQKPDVLILDVLLPQMNGFEICKKLRDNGSDTPIIFLTAKGDIVDKSTGFNAGADDYMVKPFSLVELMLRIDAILRRSRKDASNKNSASTITAGAMEIRLDSYEVLVDGRKVLLTAKEFEFLAFMAAHPGKVFTREQLLKQIWDEEFEGYANSVTVLVRKIREKIEKDPSKPTHLQTVWRVGYKFVSD
ncbi:MAG: response regulator transcription factor [Coriobacteriales bacterium]|nr:response regulator transcription factor [Coriobacteriales bacterium]